MRRRLLNTISYTLLITIVSVFACSCSLQSNKYDVVINEMEGSLKSANKAIIKNKELIFQSLKEKTTEYFTKERAEIWFPKAKAVLQLSADAYQFFQRLKTKQTFNSANAKEIITYLAKYKEAVLNIDPSIRIRFENSFPPLLNKYDSSRKSSDQLYTTYFNSKPSIARGILTVLENDILLTEKNIITFCHEQVRYIHDYHDFNSYSAIVGQNSNSLKPGGKLEITAGIGSYSKAAQPKIRINGIVTPLSEEGFATFELKAPKKPGDYTVPVLISYFNQTTGKDETRAIDINYTVTKPCDQ